MFKRIISLSFIILFLVSCQANVSKEDMEKATNFYNTGTTKFDAGNYQGALEDYNQAIKLNPKYENALYNRGYVKSQTGDLKGALEDFNKTIELNPKSGDAYFNRGQVRAKLGDKNGAVRDLFKATEINPAYAGGV